MLGLSQSPSPLGKSGLHVSPLAWGMWRFAGASTWDATRLVETALDHGITFLDTAAIYGFPAPGFGAAETLLGEVLRANPGLRSRMTLATKGGIEPGVPYDSTAANLTASLDASLARLGLDHVDLFMVHRPDVLAHPAEVARALDAMVASGRARAVGVSNYPAPMTRALLAHLQSPLAVNQIELSPLHIAPIADGTLDLALETDHAIMAWSPLGGGRLLDPQTPRDNAVANALDMHGPRDAAAHAWIAAHPARPIVILGSQRPERLARAAEDTPGVRYTRAQWYAVLVAARGQPLP